MYLSLAFRSLLAALVTHGLYRLSKLLYEIFTSPIRNLPGPRIGDPILGNLRKILKAEDSVPFEEWVGQYGPTFQYKGFFGMRQLFTMDTRALSHILANNYTYQKTKFARRALSEILGPGLVLVEEDQHKLQRKIMNPAFGPAQIRELTDVFIQKSIQLRDHWAREILGQGEKGRIDALSWLNRTTLDVIGLAGFHYDFNELHSSEKSELSSAFETVFGVGGTGNMILALLRLIPLFRLIPSKREKEIKAAKDTMDRIGEQLIRDSRQAMSDTNKGGRDLLSLLLRANTSSGPLDQQMSDQDILAQVPTFLVAGHETTSQNKLRQELWTVSTDNPTMEELNSLPYLDAVVRETMRVHTPISGTTRVAMKDDIIPLNEPYRGHDGKLYHEVKVAAGQDIVIPILVVNRAESIWGADAREFRPERWDSVPEAAAGIPGVWSNMLTFLGGPRACIGYRFSIVEMKALLFTLVRAFEFELAVPVKDLTKRTVLAQRPVLLTDPKNSNQMPLLVKPYQHASNATGTV